MYTAVDVNIYGHRVHPLHVLLFQIYPPADILCFYYGVLGYYVVTVYTKGGSTIWVCSIATLWGIPMADICASWCWFLANTGVH